ncbi:MAG: single-stranded DNA-binding protein [Chloroflexi bacterium]|nr:single-stranded DNA-binding protein [Chloroflexota bacterium]MBL01925.1 single-stranded DNA-binding protein [Chloroflexota bacterium]
MIFLVKFQQSARKRKQPLSLNQILLIGNVGNDPEMRYTSSGTPVTTFNLATNNTYRDQNGETVNETEWFRVTAWNRQAESVNQYLSKGRKVFVEGRLSKSEYVDKEGVNRSSLEVNATRVVFLSSQSGEESSSSSNLNNDTNVNNNDTLSAGDASEDIEELPW